MIVFSNSFIQWVRDQSRATKIKWSSCPIKCCQFFILKNRSCRSMDTHKGPHITSSEISRTKDRPIHSSDNTTKQLSIPKRKPCRSEFSCRKACIISPSDPQNLLPIEAIFRPYREPLESIISLLLSVACCWCIGELKYLICKDKVSGYTSCWLLLHLTQVKLSIVSHSDEKDDKLWKLKLKRVAKT